MILCKCLFCSGLCENGMLGVFVVILLGEVLMFILLFMCLSVDISEEMD